MTKWTTPDDLVARLRKGVRRMDVKPADNNAAERDLAKAAADRIEHLEVAVQETAFELIAAYGQAGDALDRVAKLETAIIAALRAPDEDSSRDILRKGLHGETTPPQG